LIYIIAAQAMTDMEAKIQPVALIYWR